MLNIQDIKDKRGFNKKIIVPTLQNAGEDKLAEQICKCSEVSDIAVCQSCGQKYFAGTFYCKSRFCSICAKNRALAWLAKLVPLFKEYLGKGYKIFMLNLTIKDQKDLSVGLDALSSAWRYMTHEDKVSRNKFRELNCGGVKSVEVKIGANSGIWHPHIHAMVMYKPKRQLKVRQYAEYKELWERAVRTAFNCSDESAKFGSVDIRGIRNSKKNTSLVSAIVETFKYIAKFVWLELSSKQVNELVETARGKHFISAWGELYGLKKQVEELLERTTEEELTNKVCAVCGCTTFDIEHALTDYLSAEYKDFS